MDQSVDHSLVASSDVDGTEVYNKSGEHVGTIDHLMIDKTSGNIAYAVMRFGGFLGIGDDYHPIPWKALSYSTAQNGFVTDISESQLKSAPERSDNWHQDRTWEKETHDYYGFPYYWI